MRSKRRSVPARILSVWADIPGYEGKYQVSDLGEVRGLPRCDAYRGRLTPGRTLRGVRRTGRAPNYTRVTLSSEGGRWLVAIHQLVALAFIGPRPADQEVRHLNGDFTDNRLSNLAYGTHAENMQDIIIHGQNYQANKTHCPQNHPYDEANTGISAGGRVRWCRICKREAQEKRRAANLERIRRLDREAKQRQRARSSLS